LWVPLEGKTFRVMDIPELNVVVVLKTILSCPCGTKVVPCILISECMELRNKMLESRKERHD
jgi:hypothetical protein